MFDIDFDNLAQATQKSLPARDGGLDVDEKGGVV